MFSPRLILIAGILAVASSCYGQDSLLLRNYQFVKRTDAWLTSQNAAGLIRLNHPSISEAEVSLTKRKGGHIDWYQSPDVLQVTANVESFTRISQRTVVFGAMTYDNFSGSDMAGSAFINPDRKPFDIVEDSLVNTGTKHRDTYRLTGAVGIDVGRGTAVGLRLDYTAANYAKYKDLRHKNKLMDLQFTAGILLPLTSSILPLTVGANYLYRRTTESVTFSLYGNEDKVYKSLIDYGTFMGRVEQFGSSGYTDQGREMPLVDDYNGASIQFSLQPTDNLTFYNALTYSHRVGYYGRKSPYTITYTNHHADLLTYEAHNKLWKNGRLAVTADLDVDGELPAWTLTAALNWHNRQQTSYLYPYYRRQHLRTTEATLSATRHLLTSKGVWTLSLTASYQKGSGDPYTDLTFADPSDKQTAPATMPAWLWREYQYIVAPQYTIGGSAAYAFIFPHTRLKTHVRFSATHRKANQTYEYSNGNDCTSLALAVGCTF